MNEIEIKLVLKSDYRAWRERFQQVIYLKDPLEDSLIPNGVRFLDIEEMSNEGALPPHLTFTYHEKTTLRHAMDQMTAAIKPILPPRKKDLMEKATGIWGTLVGGWFVGIAFWIWSGKLFIPGLINDDYYFEFPCVHRIDVIEHARKSLKALGVRSGDIFVLDYSYPVSGAMGFWADIAKDRRFWSGNFENFMSNVVADHKYTWLPDRMKRSNKPSPPCIGGIVLYTEEDWQIARHIRQYYSSLHIMSRFILSNIIRVEYMPRGKSDQETRSFWSEKIPSKWFGIWSALGLTMSKPYPNEAVYELANRISIDPDLIPCVVFFDKWKLIKEDRIVLPIRTLPPYFFRRMCADVKRAAEMIRGSQDLDSFLSSFTVESLRQAVPTWWKTERGKDVLSMESSLSPKHSDEAIPSVFLCHSSIDKQFVDRLARDLRMIGLGIWFDKWEIQVGDSIIEKIERGIEQQTYLAIVLSPEALSSSWVRKELNAAFMREIEEKRVVILPILYRRCDIPLLI